MSCICDITCQHVGGSYEEHDQVLTCVVNTERRPPVDMLMETWYRLLWKMSSMFDITCQHVRGEEHDQVLTCVTAVNSGRRHPVDSDMLNGDLVSALVENVKHFISYKLT